MMSYDRPKTPFRGDPFKIRGDYTKGTFYQSKRLFLHNDHVSDPLEPPSEFKTKKQIRSGLLIMREQATGHGFNKNLFQIVQKEEFDANQISKVQIKKQEGAKKVPRRPQNVIVERFSSVQREDWVEDYQAGCRMWVNHATGEVSSICPWKYQEFVEQQSEAAAKQGEDALGTGAKVYDNSEFLDFMNDLEAASTRTVNHKKEKV